MAGRRLSRASMTRIQAAADHLHALGAHGPGPDTRPMGASKAESLGDQIEAVARAVGMLGGQDAGYCVEDVYDGSVVLERYDLATGAETYWRAAYTVGADGSVTLAGRDAWQQVEEVWAPVNTAAKAGGLAATDDAALVFASVKALGERTMELRVSWGYDGHQERFAADRTDFDLENFPSPPVAYYHGYTEAGKPAPKPIYIGKTVKRENRADGHYLTVKLNQKPEADKVWAAALKGSAYVSPGTAGHLRRKDADGTLTYWPIVEISAWDGAPSRKQAHPASLGFPVLKALYDEAGLALPSPLDAPPEAAGDAAAVVDIDPATAAQILTATLVDLLTRTEAP